MLKTCSFMAVLLWLCCSGTLLQGHPGHENGPAPTETEVVAVIFSDYFSASCSEVNTILDELAQSKHLKIQKLFKSSPSHPDAMPAHEAALAAGAQGKFLPMHELLFKEPRPAGTALLRMAKSLDLDVKRFETALDEREFRNVVLRDMAEAKGLGVRSTPTLFINGTKIEGLEELRSLMRMPAPTPQPSWEATPVESLVLDFKGSPSAGPSNAPITLVEFTDFRCGFCRIHSQVLTELTAAYPNKIHRVFKHYPHDMSAEAAQPHLASLAALDQGKFWELHHSMMTRPLEPGSDLLDRVKALGFDTAAFERSLPDPDKRQRVQRDMAEGEALGIRATPTTFLNGRRLVGRQSIESMKRYVDELLGGKAGATAGNSAQPTPKPDETSLKASLGPAGAAVHIDAFLDLGHRESAAISAQLREFSKLRPDIRIQFRHFMTKTNALVLRAHEAVMAAADQNRFWEMADLILKSDAALTEARLNEFAERLKLDTKRFSAAMESRSHLKIIEADIADAHQRGLERPSVFVNDLFFQETLTAGNLSRYVEESSCCGRALPSTPQPQKTAVVPPQ